MRQIILSLIFIISTTLSAFAKEPIRTIEDQLSYPGAYFNLALLSAQLQ